MACQGGMGLTFRCQQSGILMSYHLGKQREAIGNLLVEFVSIFLWPESIFHLNFYEVFTLLIDFIIFIFFGVNLSVSV